MADMGPTVGGANVRITSNTKKFAGELRKKLQDIEKRIAMRLRVEVDARQLVQQANRAAKQAEQAAEQIDLPSDVDASQVVASTRRAAQAAQKAAEQIDLPLDVDATRLAGSVRRAAGAAQKAAQDIDLPMGVNVARLIASTRAAVAKARAAAGKIDVWIDVHKPKLAPLLNTFGGLTRISTAIAGLSVAAGGAVSVLGGLAPIITAVGAAAVSAAVPIGSLAAGLAPAALGGAILGVGTLKSVISGLGDVLKETDPKKYAEKFAELPSGIKPAVSELRNLQNAFKSAGENAQLAFFSKLQNLGQVQTLITPIRSAMAGLAADMGRAASGLISFTTSGTGLTAMKQLISNSSTAMGSLVGALGQAARGVIALGAAGSPIFAEMAQKINQVATAWQQKMVAGFQNGSLEAGMRRGITVLGELWAKVQQVGTIVGNVFRAMNAAGQPFLGTIGQAIQATAAWTSSAQGMGTMVSFFQSLSAATAAVAPLLGQIAGIIGGVLAPAASQAIQVLAPFVSTVLENMRTGLEAIAPVLPVVAEQLGKAMETLAPILPQVGDAIAQILQAVAPLLPLVADMAANVLPTLIPIVVGFVEAAAKVLEWAIKIWPILAIVGAAIFGLVNPFGLVMVAVGALVGALVAFWPQIKEWVGNVVQSFRDLLAQARDKVNQLEASIKEKFSSMWNAAVQKVQGMWNGVVNWFRNGINWVKNLVTSWAYYIATKFFIIRNRIVNTISNAWNTVVGWFRNGINWVKNLVSGLAQKIATGFLIIKNRMSYTISSAWNHITGWFRKGVAIAVRFVAGLAQRVGTWFSNLRNSVVTRVSGMWSSVTTRFRNGARTVIEFVKSIPRRAVDALSNLGRRLYKSGQALIQGFIDGIKSMFKKIGKAAKGAVKKARDYFPFSPAKKGPFSGRGWVLYSGHSVGEAFAEGIEQRSRGVGAATQSLMDAAQGNLDGFRADVSAVTSANNAAGTQQGRAAGDYSISVGTIIAADEERPLREMKQMQQMALIRGGVL